MERKQTPSRRKKTKIFISIVLLLLLILFVAVPLLFQKLANNKSYIEQRISNTISFPVSISSITPSWIGFSPALSFTNIVLFDDTNKTQVFTAKKFKVSLNIFYSLLHWKPTPNDVRIEDAHFIVSQRADGKWLVNGIKTPLGNNGKPFDMQDFIHSTTHSPNITLTNISIDMQPLNGTQIFVKNLHLLLKNNSFNRTLIANGSLGETSSSPFSISLKMPKFRQDTHISGNLSIKDFSPTPWLSGLNIPETNINIVFHNNSIQANINKVSINSIAINNATATIFDITHPVLKMHASINDSYKKISNVILASSLKDTLGDTLNDFKYEGLLKFLLDLTLPLSQDSKETMKINGSLTLLPTGTLHLLEDKIQLTNVEGKLLFTEDGIHSDGLQAKFLNEPLSIKISSTHSGNISSTNIDLLGIFSSNSFIETYKLDSLSKIIQGKTSFTSKIMVKQDNG